MPVWFSRLVVLVLVVGALGGGALSLAHQATYANWPWDGPPLKLPWCGRTYERAEPPAPIADAQVAAMRLYRVLEAPPVVGDEGYADIPPDEARRRDDSGEPCSETVYLRTETGYLPYALTPPQ